MKHLLLTGFILFFLTGYSQVSVEPVSNSAQAQEGTFHISKKFIVQEASSSSKEILTYETLSIIEQKRHSTDTTTHIIGNYEIVIYPKQQEKKK